MVSRTALGLLPVAAAISCAQAVESRSETDVEPIVIEITSSNVVAGEYIPSSYTASYRGTTIALEAIETPGSELEYPRVGAPIGLPVGTPIRIDAERKAVVAVFELLPASGEFVESGSCIVPGALAALPDDPGPSAFFIYAEWPDSAGGMAFTADLVAGEPAANVSASPTPAIDGEGLGLAVCEDA